MVNLILTSLYFILPAYAANMMPVFAMKLNLPLAAPISIKYLGGHKTYRGFIAAYFGALLVLFLQYYLQKEQIFPSSSSQSNLIDNLLDYEQINLFLYAFVFGIGAMAGDTLKSLFKRRLNLEPGHPFFPFDQLDFILGAMIFLIPFYQPPLENILVILIFTPLLHFLANVLAYFLRLKSVWW